MHISLKTANCGFHPLREIFKAIHEPAVPAMVLMCIRHTHLGLAVGPSRGPLARKQVKGELGVQDVKVYT